MALSEPGGEAAQAVSAKAERAESDALPEQRLAAVIERLEDAPGAQDAATLGDHLALLRRWYYRPEKQRSGTLFQRERDAWPLRRMVYAAAKLAAPEPPAAEVAVSAAQASSAEGSSAATELPTKPSSGPASEPSPGAATATEPAPSQSGLLSATA